MPIAGKDDFHGNQGPIHTSFNQFHLPIEEDFVKAAYETTATQNTLQDAWGGDHLGFFSSLGVVDRVGDIGTRSYSASGYLRPHLGRPNLKVLTEALASKIMLDGNTAIGLELLHGGKAYKVRAKREVVLSAGVVQTPQLLELSGIGDPRILEAAGIPCAVPNPRVGANFQDHVLSGLVYDLIEGIGSMDSLHDESFAEEQRQIYAQGRGGMYANPGMLMGFISYASLVSPEELEATVARITKSSVAETDFEKAQEEVSLVDLQQSRTKMC